DGVSVAPKITVDDARVDWSAPALRVDRLIRACTPQPGGWTTFRGRRLKLGPVEPVDGDVPDLLPGRLLDQGTHGVLVGTGGAPVRLGDVRPEGRAAMPAPAWARGVRLGPDD